jgi:hypothetical protein
VRRAACDVNALVVQAIDDQPVSERLAFMFDDLLEHIVDPQT